jgi:iron complex outermembrane recepter protein
MSSSRTFPSTVKPIAYAALIALMSGGLTVAHAQTATTEEKKESTEPNKAEAPRRLEAIEVTANKRVQRLEQVPAAISVITSEQLERQNVRNLDDVVNMTPALTVTYGSTAANNGINMRGIGTTSIGIGVEADVAVIIDDIPLGQQFMAFRDLSDVQRIEVLKGPQSTLVGKNAIAGAVSIVTKPATGPLRGEAMALVSNDGEKRIRASYGGSIGERFGLRLAVSSNDYEGNVLNLTTGRMVNGTRGQTFLAKALWRITDSLDVEFSPRYNYTDSSCCTLVPTSFTNLQFARVNNNAAAPATLAFADINVAPGNNRVRNDVETGIESRTRGAGLRVNYLLGNDAQLTSITSTEHYTAKDVRDQDFIALPTLLYLGLGTTGGPAAGVNEGYIQGGTYDIKSKTQELRYTSPDAGNFKYVLGLWYGKNEIEREFTRGYNNIPASTPVRYIGTTYNINTALFGQASWEFMPKYLLTVGARFNNQDSGYSIEFLNPYPLPTARRAGASYFESKGNKENASTGKVALQHQFSRDVMAYAQLSTGYKGQAYDVTSGVTAASASEQPIKSETATNFELGFKGNFMDNRLSVSVTAFNARFKDYQQNSGSFLPNSSTFVTRLSSIGGVQTRGVELDVGALLTSRWLVNASLAYTEATITEWPNAPCYNVAGSPNGGLNLECRRADPNFGGTNVQDLKGKGMPNAPRVKVNVSSRYDFPMFGFKGSVTGALKYQTDTLTNINQDPDLAVKERAILDLGFGLADSKERYRLSFNVNNVTNEAYANTGFTGLGNFWIARQPPSTTNLPVRTSTWTPARDAFRYVTVRFDAKF